MDKLKMHLDQKQRDLLNSKLLIGQWRSEADAKYVLVFKKEKYIEIYDKDTTDGSIINYRLLVI
jgi:hypothetical protein